MSEMASHGGVPQWTLADRLRKAREHAGLTQDELAHTIDVARRTVGNYENGSHRPRRPVLLSWAMRCGVPLEWLETGVAPTPGPGSDTRGYANSGRRLAVFTRPALAAA